MITPTFCLPGMTSRASAPTMRPTTMAPMMVPITSTPSSCWPVVWLDARIPRRATSDTPADERISVVRYGVVVLVVWLVAVGSAGPVRADGDPGALWRIVDGQCVPNEVAHGDPAPCASVELGPQGRSGWAVLKDLVGATQFLLIPTQRTSGIDDPAILAPDAPNYFAAAWKARSFVDERAGSRLPRDQLSLAINSTFARSQDQLHI